MTKENNMNNSPKTRVAIVLDKSHSMARTAEQAISGYNSQIEALKKKAAEGQNILVSLVTFCGEVFEHQWDQPAESLQPASMADYKLGDWTAMRDAVGYTVEKLKNTDGVDDENTAYLMVIISDGETNKDEKYAGSEGVSRLKELIQGCQNTGKWTFTYLGCSQAYLEQVSRETGVPISNMAAWSNATAKQTTNGMRNAVDRSMMYFTARSEGKLSSKSYMSDTVGTCADFTSVDDKTTPKDEHIKLNDNSWRGESLTVNEFKPTFTCGRPVQYKELNTTVKLPASLTTRLKDGEEVV